MTATTCLVAALLGGLAGPLPAERAPVPASALAPGTLLVASRDLVDPNFRQTVVLLVHYGPEGALGLIVNRPTNLRLGDLLPDLGGVEGREDLLWEGGPVLRTRFLYLALTGEPVGDMERVLERVHFGTSVEGLETLLQAGLGESELRVFAGHAGWGPGQLDRELRAGGWSVTQASEGRVFSETPERLWLELDLAGRERMAGVAVGPRPMRGGLFDRAGPLVYRKVKTGLRPGP